MLLSEYLDTTEMTHIQFAQKIQVTRASIYQWLSGSYPSLPMAHRIVLATGGLVSFEDLLRGVTLAKETQAKSSTSSKSNPGKKEKTKPRARKLKRE
mgnify:CR=1 FL=1